MERPDSYSEKRPVSHFLVRRNEYEFDPNFQREEVWSRNMKQYFIDSILRGIDTQKIFVRVKKDGTFSVVDGQQRLRTIWEFAGLEGKRRMFPLHACMHKREEATPIRYAYHRLCENSNPN